MWTVVVAEEMVRQPISGYNMDTEPANLLMQE